LRASTPPRYSSSNILRKKRSVEVVARELGGQFFLVVGQRRIVSEKPVS